MDSNMVNVITFVNYVYELSLVYVYPPKSHNRQPTMLDCLFLIDHVYFTFTFLE